MLVVADTSPLHYLILIEQIQLLPTLFGQIVIPAEVARELSHPKTPGAVQSFIADPPSWISVRTTHHMLVIPRIDRGKAAAISLAKEVEADLLLIDDSDGRAAARRLNIAIIGVGGVLDLAAHRKLIDLPETIRKLKQTSIRLSDDLIDALLHPRRPK